MTRSKCFHSSHEPLHDAENALQTQTSHINGPIPFLNPTRAHFRHLPSAPLSEDSSKEPPYTGQKAEGSHKGPSSNVQFKWRSRDNRKGRHALLIDSAVQPTTHIETPKHTASFRAVVQGLLRMILVYPYWDISYLVATTFTLGSVVWVMNSFFVFLPLSNPSTEFQDEVLTAGGIMAFIGATIFEVGSVLLMLEAVNENRSGCFGWAIEKALRDEALDEDRYAVKPNIEACAHHHTNKKNLVGKGGGMSPNSGELTHNGSLKVARKLLKATDSNKLADEANEDGKKSVETVSGRSWVWFPSTYDLKTHYLREIGFLACLFQFLGATIFWISGFTALPGINNMMSQGLLDGIYWTPQVIGGSGFIISG
ncbi:MAG: hypothetical protein Q9225_005264 [Loekoesia sp. 1 TL-2023]